MTPSSPAVHRYDHQEGERYAARWARFYHQHWPGWLVHRVQSAEAQVKGHDVYLLSVGEEHSECVIVDEKVRHVSYRDCGLEIFHRYDDGSTKLGWVVDPTKTCSLIAYASDVHQRCWLLPYATLRDVTRHHETVWAERYTKKACRNVHHTGNWYTDSLYVPWDVLRAHMPIVDYPW